MSAALGKLEGSPPVDHALLASSANPPRNRRARSAAPCGPGRARPPSGTSSGGPPAVTHDPAPHESRGMRPTATAAALLWAVLIAFPSSAERPWQQVAGLEDVSHVASLDLT